MTNHLTAIDYLPDLAGSWMRTVTEHREASNRSRDRQTTRR
jgi:hypothetical protein